MAISKYFLEARKEANKSSVAKYNVGCVAVYKGKVIARGYNSEKTHPLQEKYNQYRELEEESLLPKLHAEIRCLSYLKNMDIDFKKVKLFIYRIKRKQPYGMARPCNACMKAIVDLGIKEIYYTTDFGYAHESVGKDVESLLIA